MTCTYGDGVILCDGKSNGIVEYRDCPFCLERALCLSWWIYSGYEGKDSICGNCGWSWGDEWGLPHDVKAGTSKWEEMEANKAKVASVTVPNCMLCQDTGDQRATMIPILAYEKDPVVCGCGAWQ